MRRSLVFMIQLSLMVFAFSQRGNVSIAKASPTIHQGDLILTGNNVTTIEGRFDINGSIVVTGNATLVLNNAEINFTQGSAYEFNITLTNPINGNPRLFGDNATIISEEWLRLYLNPGSSASFNGTTFSKVGGVYVDSANVTLSYSTTLDSSWYFSGDSQSNMLNSSVNYLLAYDTSNCTVQNSTLLRALVNPHQVNFTVHGLRQGFFNYWKFRENCSVILKSGGYSPDLTFINTQVDYFALLFSGTCDVTIMASEIGSFNPYGTITAGVYDSVLTMVVARISAQVHIFNTTIMTEVQSQNNAKIWLVNSTSPRYHSIGRSEIYLNWYLDVHVIDSMGQDVPSANVTATDPNATIADSEQTNPNGRTKLILMEKMINVTGEYPVGNYTVEATYSIHKNETAVNMTENKQVTLTLEGFVIPEFPSLIILPLFMFVSLLAVLVCRGRKRIARLSN